jgi:hypothetical protein
MRVVPLVYNTAPQSAMSQKWAECMDSGVQDWLRRYYDTRFAFMLAAFVSAPPSQQSGAYESARSLARRFTEASDLHVEYHDDEEKGGEREEREKEKLEAGSADKELSSVRSASGSPPSTSSSHPKYVQPKDSDDVFCDLPVHTPSGHRADEPTWLQETHPLRRETSRTAHETMGGSCVELMCWV